MDITRQPLVSDAEIQQLLHTSTHRHHAHKISNQFAAAGEHPAQVIGRGMDFADRQPYNHGDDPRFIDWRASARSNHTLIRRYHSELSTPSCIVIDRRAGMLFGTKTRLKATQAIRVGIHCGAQLLKAGQQLACLILDEKNYWQAPTNSLASFSQTAHYAARACPPTQYTQKPQWAHNCDVLRQKLTQGSRLVLISDFISPPSSIASDQKALRLLSQHYNLNLLHICDTAEQQWRQYGIELKQNQQHKVLKKTADIIRFNQQLTQYHAQQKEYFNSIPCAHQLIHTHDNVAHINII